MVRRLFAAAFLALSLGAPLSLAAEDPSDSQDPDAGSQTDQESSKREDIRRLLEITGTPEIGLRITQRIVENIKRSHPEVPDKFWNEFEQEMTKDEFIGIIIPLYEKKFTHDDIEKLITFFKTDVGQKYVDKLPDLSTKSIQAGRRWGQKLGQRIVDKLQARGYE